MLITFFCTRCGTRLETEAENADGRVRCEQCAGVTRVPGLVDGIPFARVAATTAPDADSHDPMVRDIDASHDGIAPPAASADVPPALSYLPSGPDRRARSVLLDQQAERLTRVEGDDEGNPDRHSTACPFCGSTIAPFVKTCPYCRHPLWGV